MRYWHLLIARLIDRFIIKICVQRIVGAETLEINEGVMGGLRSTFSSSFYPFIAIDEYSLRPGRHVSHIRHSTSKQQRFVAMLPP